MYITSSKLVCEHIYEIMSCYAIWILFTASNKYGFASMHHQTMDMTSSVFMHNYSVKAIETKIENRIPYSMSLNVV